MTCLLWDSALGPLVCPQLSFRRVHRSQARICPAGSRPASQMSSERAWLPPAHSQTERARGGGESFSPRTHAPPLWFMSSSTDDSRPFLFLQALVQWPVPMALWPECPLNWLFPLCLLATSGPPFSRRLEQQRPAPCCYTLLILVLLLRKQSLGHMLLVFFVF